MKTPEYKVPKDLENKSGRQSMKMPLTDKDKQVVESKRMK